MINRKLYLENDKLFCDDSNGNKKRLNNSYRIHKILNGIITNGYKIVFSGSNMILKSKKGQIELVDYINLLDNKNLSFLEYDIKKKLSDNNKKVKNKNRASISLKDEKLIYIDSNGDIRELDSSYEVHCVLDEFITSGYKVVFLEDDMILVGHDKQLLLKDFLNLLDNSKLAFLNYDIYRRVASNWYLDFFRKKRKSFRKYFIRNVACFSLIFSFLGNIFPVSASGLRRNVSETENDINASISENDDSSSLSDSFYVKKLNFNYRYFDDIQNDTILFSENNGDNSFNDELSDDSVNSKSSYSDEDIEKIFSFMSFNHLSIDDFANLINLMTSDECPFGALYSSYEEAIRALMEDEISYQVKFLTIMIREGNTYAEIDKMCAGVCGEAYGGGHCYDDAYAVASTLVNRTHKDSYVTKYGYNLYSQFCAPGQYEVDISGNYKQYLGRIDLEGYQAAIDAFYTREAMHNYLEFRANWYEMDYKYETFVTGGNKFIIKMKDSAYVPYPDEEAVVLDDVKELVLTKTNS